MPNSYFEFKQFRVEQGQCAMKVSTEACLFGALIEAASASRALDIGTGTGLLSLMVAQRFDLTIDAIEIDSLAAKQAFQNVQSSPFENRIEVYEVSLQDFEPSDRYDLIITNPPFYKRGFKSIDNRRNQAMRSDTLSLEELAENCDRLLSGEGQLWILLPEYEMNVVNLMLRRYGLYEKKVFIIRNRTGDQKIFRKITTFSREQIEEPKRSEISIRDLSNEYSSEFIQHLNPYYLSL